MSIEHITKGSVVIATAGEKAKTFDAWKADYRAMTEERDKWREKAESFEKTNAALKRTLVRLEEENISLRNRNNKLTSHLDEFKRRHRSGSLATAAQFEECEKERKALIKYQSSIPGLNPRGHLQYLDE